MFIVVTGGSGSGKSAYAEDEIQKLGTGQRIYVATMMSFDEESKKRIARHRKLRENKCFETRECYTGLKKRKFSKDNIVLLECMSNLVANEMFDESGAKTETVPEIMDGIRSLKEQVRHLVAVTNEIFSDGFDYDEETKRYQRYLGEINQAMAAMADRVVEVVYGIPLIHKKEVLSHEHH